MVQFSHLYITTGKSIALTIWTFVSRVLSLLFNMQSRCVIAFLQRRKHFLNYMVSVILEPPKIKSDTVSPSISHEVMGPDAMIVYVPHSKSQHLFKIRKHFSTRVKKNESTHNVSYMILLEIP